MKVLYVLFLLDTLSLAIYLPVFAAFVRSIGGTPFTLGLINSSSALVTLLWNPIAGSLSDQVGRKGLLTKCMIASSIGSLILCASSSSLILVFIARIIGALGSPVAILLRSTVADVFKTDEEKKTFLNKSAPVISLAFLVGSLCSGFLSEANNGFVLAFLLMAIISGLASFITHQNLTTTVTSKQQIKNPSSFIKKAAQEVRTAAVNIKSIDWPRYRTLFYMRGSVDFSMATMISNVGLFLLQEYDVKGRVIGYVFLLIGISRMVSAIVKLKLKNVLANVPDHSKIFYGAIVELVTFLGMGLSTSLYSFLGFLVVMCLTRPFVDSTFIEMIAIKTQDSDRGKVMAAFDNILPFCMFVAPVMSGVVAQFVGQRALMFFAVLPISVAIWIAYKQKNKTD